MQRLFRRSLQPPPIEPNDTVPPESDPGTVGVAPTVTPGDPDGVVFETLEAQGGNGAFRILPSPWSGWPAEWWPPLWDGRMHSLTDTAWACIDLNASVLSAMPPYLLNAADSLNADWVNNPNPDLYTCWEEFCKQLFWDYQMGEVFVLATARYATGFPARFNVVPPWYVEIEQTNGRRTYTIGGADVTDDLLHIRYQSRVGDAHGHGPLEAGWARMVADRVLTQYATTLAAGGGIPAGVLEYEPDELTEAQAQKLKAQWVQARASSIGEPAVLSGGVKWTPTQINPEEMALVDLQELNESRIAVLLQVPPFLVGLPSGGNSMTYSNVRDIVLHHWRVGLRPKAQLVMSALSGWLLPRGTRVELNRDAYIEPEPYVRAQTWQILAGIKDPSGNPVVTVPEIRASERLDNSTPSDLQDGVLR